MKPAWIEGEEAPSGSPAGGGTKAQPSLSGDAAADASHLPTGNEDYYTNENGLVVFTERYLLARGYCCGNGCLHCPYGYEAVPEPKKSILLERRKQATG